MIPKFPTTIVEAKIYQEGIAKKIILSDSFLKSSIVGAFDIAYKENTAFAAGVIYDCSTKSVIEEKVISDRVEFPYVPNYLFLREVPHFLTLLDRIVNIPDIMIIDGHGIAHPRTAGSASIFGIIANIPSIGVAKKPMKFFSYKETNQDNLDEVYLNQNRVGFRYKFEKKWNPIYISPGHKISFESSYNITKGLLTSKHKLPIPQQLAHLLAAKYKKTII
ncbi:MAG: endonuclease V [Candidatus Heimdallarchaeota archaeon]|nr:endonuclease V [Candidatus Heimdallarchaeota archaeon]